MALMRCALIAIFTSALVCGMSPTAAVAQDASSDTIKDVRVIIKTNKGDVHATIYASKVPMTAANFINLAQRKYYDGIVFHRVIPDFMAQVGDPQSRDPQKKARWGTGGPGYKFADEFDATLRHNRPGILSMANSGPNTNGSQIFITHVPTPHLDRKHSVFGAVTEGMDVVNAITVGDKIESIKVVDDASALLKSQADNIKKWNVVLDNPAQ